MWAWDYSLKVEEKFFDYHFSSINAEEYTSTQLYKHYKRKEKSNKGYIKKELPYTFDLASSFEKTILNRKTCVGTFSNNQRITMNLIARFSQLAFIGGEGGHRAYPSGGARYYVNIHYMFHNERVDEDLWKQGNISELNMDTNQLLIKDSIPWQVVEDAFIQKKLVSTAQFAIVLSVDLQSISKKYTDISYKLVQQEAGHIGQNIQLVSTYLGMQSLPLGGFYDLEVNRLIGGNETTLYVFLIG
ncbi:SagB/ThcOx family dehydrogenase [Oceanobacillus piezotolerans]|uniref:SagB/ThcOx family dehydrogenase n=1 Tax=Oceanobacillus piezotolerans TaxID=2448030 RepID=A0A498DBN4_9BACI|nr:SagB/ThcOx family dehydrogenase [Oceanobacillus piezotolerans]RLL42887.1 SagB/ThcOx family dehydrogenase [Oceanobacillus piezotolerans]